METSHETSRFADTDLSFFSTTSTPESREAAKHVPLVSDDHGYNEANVQKAEREIAAKRAAKKHKGRS